MPFLFSPFLLPLDSPLDTTSLQLVSLHCVCLHRERERVQFTGRKLEDRVGRRMLTKGGREEREREKGMRG